MTFALFGRLLPALTPAVHTRVCKDLDASIVSNDELRDREKTFPDAARRLIKYVVMRGEVVLERRTGRRED